MAANVGGNVETTFRTFEFGIGPLEDFLREKLGNYAHRQVIGVELFTVDTEGKHGG
jgi:hypothetical protein